LLDERYGFRPLEHVEIELPDGVLGECVSMEMAVD
jgi:hypothetical protein